MPDQIPYELENGDIVIADLCYCGETKDDTTYLVEFDNGDLVIAHESCLEIVDG